jgi:hypothetical protein
VGTIVAAPAVAPTRTVAIPVETRIPATVVPIPIPAIIPRPMIAEPAPAGAVMGFATEVTPVIAQIQGVRSQLIVEVSVGVPVSAVNRAIEPVVEGVVIGDAYCQARSKAMVMHARRRPVSIGPGVTIIAIPVVAIPVAVGFTSGKNEAGGGQTRDEREAFDHPRILIARA